MSSSLASLRCSGAILAFSVIALAGCGPSAPPAPPAMPPMPVSVLEAMPVTVPASVEVSAQTEGARETEVRPRVGGILVKVLYREGESVKAGQALFQIDKAPYEIALAQARGQLADVRNKAEQTAREENRLKGLVAIQAISRKEYDDATSAATSAKAALQSAEANVRNAELNLGWTTVTAPISGVTGRSAYSEGNLMSVGQTTAMTTVFQSSPIWVRFGLSEGEAASLPGGKLSPSTVKAVELVLPDGRVYGEKGRVNFTSSQLDLRLGTVQLRAEFDNKDGKLLPGQFVRARVIGGDRQGVFLVPQGAVMQSETGRMVFVVDKDNKAQPRPVTTGEWQGSNWVILSGLKGGDKVVLDNLIKLRPGAPVQPKKPGEQAPAGAAGAAAASGAASAPPASASAASAKP